MIIAPGTRAEAAYQYAKDVSDSTGAPGMKLTRTMLRMLAVEHHFNNISP